MSQYPYIRLRRSRQADWCRRLVAEVELSVSDLIWPLFVVEDESQKGAIATLPGVSRLSVGEAVLAARQAWELGIPAIALFPSIDPAKKDTKGSEALNPDNLVCRTVAAIKDAVPDLGIICDVALDPYTSHGQDGLLKHGRIINDDTVAILCEQALVQAEAGCDVLAPSDMMDGRIRAIRSALESSGFHDTLLLSYAVKYASAFYGPFRDAVGSAKALGAADKKTYQMSANRCKEALFEAKQDVAEGADWLMVKPGMPYLDVLARVSQAVDVPVLAYQVSGEYAALHFAADNGAGDYEAMMMEAMLAFKRAGASAIFSYAALDVARWLRG